MDGRARNGKEGERADNYHPSNRRWKDRRRLGPGWIIVAVSTARYGSDYRGPRSTRHDLTRVSLHTLLYIFWATAPVSWPLPAFTMMLATRSRRTSKRLREA